MQKTLKIVSAERKYVRHLIQVQKAFYVILINKQKCLFLLSKSKWLVKNNNHSSRKYFAKIPYFPVMVLL